MFVVLGSTGHVGFSTVQRLRQNGHYVRAIIRNPEKAASLQNIGCEVAIADMQDVNGVIEAINGAEAVQVIVPFRPQVYDPVASMRQCMHRLIDALRTARPKRILAISDYGAHINHDIGMPSIFRDFEALLTSLDGEKLILRSAEHMHNWSRNIPAALASGIMPTLQVPIEMKQPAIAARDLGCLAADVLSRPDNQAGVQVIHVEGPDRYSASDVAAAISQLSGRRVIAQAVPRSEWSETLAKMPPVLAELLTKTSEARNNGGLIDIEPNGIVLRGTTKLTEALRALVKPVEAGS